MCAVECCAYDKRTVCTRTLNNRIANMCRKMSWFKKNMQIRKLFRGHIRRYVNGTKCLTYIRRWWYFHQQMTNGSESFYKNTVAYWTRTTAFLFFNYDIMKIDCNSLRCKLIIIHSEANYIKRYVIICVWKIDYLRQVNWIKSNACFVCRYA